MVHHFFLTCALVLFNHFFLHYEYGVIYSTFVDLTSRFQLTLLFYSFTGSILLIILSYWLTSIGLFRITYFISKALLRCSQFLLVFLSVTNIIFWFQLENCFLSETGFAPIAILWIIMIGSCLAIRAADFNYHLRGPLIPGILLPILSETTVQLASLYVS
jgi:hypothetical protein